LHYKEFFGGRVREIGGNPAGRRLGKMF